MNKYLKSFLLVVAILLLIILCAPIFGWIHENIFNDIGGGWIGGSNSWAYIAGLFSGFVFFVPLILTIFGGKYKYYIIVVLVALDLLFMFGYWQGLIIDLSTAIFGWLIGEGVLRLYKMSKSVKK